MSGCSFTNLKLLAKQTEALTKKAGEIVGAMNTALSNNQDAIARAFEANRNATEASEKQSIKALNASIELAHNEQRAWVSVRPS